jgi:hypothetical protein
MILASLWKYCRLGMPHTPQPDEKPFRKRAEMRQDDELVVRAAVLDDRASEQFFGVNLACRGIPPVWLQIVNQGGHPYRLRLASLDPNVDDARDNVLDDLMEAGRVALAGYATGLGAGGRTAPRRDLTGDPYFTDGLRAVAEFSETRANPRLPQLGIRSRAHPARGSLEFGVS